MDVIGLSVVFIVDVVILVVVVLETLLCTLQEDSKNVIKNINKNNVHAFFIDIIIPPFKKLPIKSSFLMITFYLFYLVFSFITIVSKYCTIIKSIY